ncbi:helix-turn-helix domain-containing protein [Nocardia sp. IFM 10818]
MAGSTLASRALGRLLAQHRKRVGLTRYAAGQIVDTSQQTMGRIEDGLKAKVSQLWINAWADAYQVSDDDRRLMLDLAHDMAVAEKNWWRAYADGLRSGFDHYMGLEGAARKLTTWKLAIVPGMLQTPEYRRAIAWFESPNLPHDQVENRVEVAMRRRARLDDETFTLEVLISEMVLLDQIGGPGVMTEQLRHLVDVSQRSNVSVRVVPLNASGHPGSLVGSFVLLEFPKLPATGLLEPPVVYVEGYAGDLYMEREPEVQRYRDAFVQIDRVALDQYASRQLILSLVKEYDE